MGGSRRHADIPQEPIVTVKGPIIQAQFVESMILLLINHQSLIATKANRIVRSAKGRGVMEFGTRRAHGTAAAVYGARAANIGGCIRYAVQFPTETTVLRRWEQWLTAGADVTKTNMRALKNMQTISGIICSYCCSIS